MKERTRCLASECLNDTIQGSHFASCWQWLEGRSRSHDKVNVSRSFLLVRHAGAATTTLHAARNAIAAALLVRRVQEGEEAALAAEGLAAETGVLLHAVRGTGTARRWISGIHCASLFAHMYPELVLSPTDGHQGIHPRASLVLSSSFFASHHIITHAWWGLC